MKKKWIFIAVIVGILLLAAFRYSLVEESEQLPDKVRLGSLLGSEALAETEEPDTEEETGAAVGLLPAAGLNPEDESSAPAQTTSAPSPEEAVTEPVGAEQPAQDSAQPEEEPEEAAPTAEEEPAPRLKRGDSGREVKALQQHLKKLGFLKGAADGIFGAQTERAVVEFKEHVYEMQQEQRRREEAEQLRVQLQEAQSEAEAAQSMTEVPQGEAEAAQSMTEALQGEAEAAQSMTEAPQGEAEAAQSMTEAPQGEAEAAQSMTEVPQSEAEASGSEEEEAQPEEKPVFDGSVDEEAYRLLVEGEFDEYQQTLRSGARGAEVRRMQKRLKSLGYLSGSADGIFGKKTVQAVTAFQKRHKLTQDGIAGEKTQRTLYSASALRPVKQPSRPYVLKVSTKDQRVYAYGWSERDEAHTKLVRTMVCSTGLADTPTPKGTYSANTAPVVKWGYFPKYDVWAQYLYRIQGPYLFHSVLFDEADESTVRWGSVNKLGSPASHGCIRLSVEDAGWIYKNCPAGTTVTIY